MMFSKEKQTQGSEWRRKKHRERGSGNKSTHIGNMWIFPGEQSWKGCFDILEKRVIWSLAEKIAITLTPKCNKVDIAYSQDIHFISTCVYICACWFVCLLAKCPMRHWINLNEIFVEWYLDKLYIHNWWAFGVHSVQDVCPSSSWLWCCTRSRNAWYLTYYRNENTAENFAFIKCGFYVVQSYRNSK